GVVARHRLGIQPRHRGRRRRRSGAVAAAHAPGHPCRVLPLRRRLAEAEPRLPSPRSRAGQDRGGSGDADHRRGVARSRETRLAAEAQRTRRARVRNARGARVNAARCENWYRAPPPTATNQGPLVTHTFTGWFTAGWPVVVLSVTKLAACPSNSEIPSAANTAGSKPLRPSGSSPKTYVALAST